MNFRDQVSHWPSQPVASRISRSGEALLRIRMHGRATVSELVEDMGLARSTVLERVDRLRRHGLVRIVDSQSNGRGRPATTYEFEPRAGLILTCHVGMTGMRLGVTDLAANLIADRLIDQDIELGPEVVTSTIESGFAELLKEIGETDSRVDGIGVGLPGSVELSSTSAVDPSWTSFPMARRLSTRFEAPSFVDQDVNMLALGETQAWPTARVLMCVKVGTVIGCGVVVDGQIVFGADGLAGEIGHTRIPGRDDVCACGSRGCLSAVAGGRALAEQLAALGHEARHARDVVRLAEEGVPEAQLLIRQAGRDIGTVLAGAVNLLNPRVIALWGYLVGAEEPLVAGIRETLYPEATPSATHHLQLVSSELGENTGLSGAAIMVADQILAPAAIDVRLASADQSTG